jgi:hypothetical protein
MEIPVHAAHALQQISRRVIVDGSYRGQDHQNRSHPDFTNYTTLSIWDIYLPPSRR